MTVDELYTLIRESLNRGTTLDAVIPSYIAGAVRQIEELVDVRDMEKWYDFTMDETDNPPYTALPDRFKKIPEAGFVRVNTANAGDRPKWEYLSKMPPSMQISRVGRPQRYWLYGRSFMVMDALPDKEYSFEARILEYTQFPAEGSSSSHWLLDRAPLTLHGKVMTDMSMFIREDDPRIVQGYKTQFTEGLEVLRVAEEYSKESDSKMEIEFWPDHIPFDKAFHDSET